MKMKLLSPAGDEKSLKLAVYNGADEIYLGVKDFNARNNIQGFDLDELSVAVAFCHMYSVKVYLTVNILFADDEMQRALELIVDANNIGIDAFIIQDIGLAATVKKYYPNIIMHASTQMAVHNLEGVKELERLGFARVVLARETSLDEIRRIHDNSNIEIEFFVHGALCVSFSGNCYLSSYLEDASGNRGKCKQLCRLPYTLSYNKNELTKGYLLSAKDLCLIDYLEELGKAGVTSLKIEGRARRPYYVAAVTKAYRETLDQLDEELCDNGSVQSNGKKHNQITDKTRRDLELAFNRGFTPAYFGDNKMISKVQGHNGIEIGMVAKVNKGKTFNEIFIRTDYDISPKSSLKFFRRGAEITTAASHDVQKINGLIRITTTISVEVGDTVNIFVDYSKEKIAEEFIKKIPVKIVVNIRPDMQAEVVLNARDKEVKYCGQVLPLAEKKSLTIEEVIATFKRSEFFEPIVTGVIGNVFILKSQLNELRREAYSMLQTELIKNNNKLLNKVNLPAGEEIIPFKNFEIVEKVDEISKKHTNFVLNTEYFDKNELLDIKNRCEILQSKLYLYLPHFATNKDIVLLKKIVEELNIGIIINNLYALNFKTDEKTIGPGLNIFNTYSAKYFDLPLLVAENISVGAERMNAPYMILRHCPIKEFSDEHCGDCKYHDDMHYTMQNGRRLRLKRWKLDSCTFYLTD